MNATTNPVKVCPTHGELEINAANFYFIKSGPKAGKPFGCRACLREKSRKQKAAAAKLTQSAPPTSRISLERLVAAEITLGKWPRSRKVHPAIRIKCRGGFRNVSAPVQCHDSLSSTKAAHNAFKIPGAKLVAYGFYLPSKNVYVWIPFEKPSLPELRQAQAIVTTYRSRVRADDCDDEDDSVTVLDKDNDSDSESED